MTPISAEDLIDVIERAAKRINPNGMPKEFSYLRMELQQFIWDSSAQVTVTPAGKAALRGDD